MTGIIETIRETRFTELGYVQDAPKCWRICFLGDGPNRSGFYPRVGPHYKTKAELLTDLQRYADSSGWNATN